MGPRARPVSVAIDKIISAAEAARHFSRVLREVGEGRSYTVTLHGRPLARIIPAGDETELRIREAAKTALLGRLGRLPAQSVGTWSRDELYDR